MSVRHRDGAPAWVADAVFYQIFPDRFRNGDTGNDPPGTVAWGTEPNRQDFCGGDLQGVKGSLDYLQELGIDAIYLNPIFQAETNHRYDTSDYFRVDPALGDLNLLKELVDDMHTRGMRLILDGVFNHCGLGFGPFRDVLENGESSRYKDWFLARDYPLTAAPLNYQTCGGCTYLPKLNHGHPPVREFLLDVARYWLVEANIDGWRLDVPFKVPMSFWREFRRVVREANPEAYLVGEVWRDASPWIAGDVFDGVTNYRLRDLIFDFVLTGVLDAEDFGFELHSLLDAHGTAARSMVNLLDSHDTRRVLTSFGGDVEGLRLALTLQMTLPGAPMIYYGNEVGLQGETDPDCRRCMPWDEKEWDADLLSVTRALIGLRRAHPALRHGDLEVLYTFDGVFAYRMRSGDDEVMVIVNPRGNVADVRVPVDSGGAPWVEWFTKTTYHAVQETAGGQAVVAIGDVPACSALVLVPER